MSENNKGGIVRMSLAELHKWCEENPEPTLVRYDADHETYDLDVGHGFIDDNLYYFFDVERCRTPEQLLDWLRHLLEKTWFTATHARQLIALCEQNGMRIPHNS